MAEAAGGGAAPELLGERRWWQRPRLVGAVALAILAVGTCYLAFFGPSQSSPTNTQAGLATVAATRTTLTTQELVSGTIGYSADPQTLAAPAAGVVDSVSQVGSRLESGDVLYRLNGQPIVLLYGKRAAWRTLVAGMSGVDVRQLNTNLRALGYLKEKQAAATFTASTEAAMRALQRSVGAPVTGIVLRGGAVFAPGAMRVTATPAPLGSQIAAAATVLQIASDQRVVTAALNTAQQDTVAVGDPVQIQLPSGASIAGVVAEISYSANTPSTVDQSASSSSGTSTGNPSSAEASVTMTVRLRNQSAGAGLEQTPVQVVITTGSKQNALAVPVAALLAQPGGGYAVVLERGGKTVTVPVTTGMFSDTSDLVEITSGELRAGDQVRVPQ